MTITAVKTAAGWAFNTLAAVNPLEDIASWDPVTRFIESKMDAFWAAKWAGIQGILAANLCDACTLVAMIGCLAFMFDFKVAPKIIIGSVLAHILLTVLILV